MEKMPEYIFAPTKKVINRRANTLPLPTTETRIKAIDQVPNLLLLKEALHTNTTPLRSQFAKKKYHNNELTSQQQLCLQNGIIYQIEQPMATGIRKL